MRAVVQRVTRAAVRVDDEVVGEVTSAGLVVLVGVTHDDSAEVAARLAAKIWKQRILRNELSCSDTGAPLLVISQFTLYADTRKGRRPSWNEAAPAAVGEPLYEEFVAALRALGAEVTTGRFGAMMEVELINDGPVTLILEA